MLERFFFTYKCYLILSISTIYISYLYGCVSNSGDYNSKNKLHEDIYPVKGTSYFFINIIMINRYNTFVYCVVVICPSEEN